MIKKKIFVISLLLLALLWHCTERNDVNKVNGNNNETISINYANHNNELIFNFEKIKKNKIIRNFKHFDKYFMFKIGSIDDETFYFPGRIKLDNAGNIYILDFLDYSVKKFDHSGRFIEKFGKKGQGPGELVNPYDFDVDENGKVAFLGLNDNKFIIFEGNRIIEYKTKLMPNRVCFVNSEEVVTFQIMDPIETPPLQKINLYSKSEIDYENFINKNSFGEQNIGLIPSLVGNIHKYRSGKLIYISSILGYIVEYSEDGSIREVFKLVDDYKEEKSKTPELPNIVRFPYLHEYLHVSSNIFQDKLFIYANPIRWSPQRFVVDVYSISNHRYLYSLQLDGFENVKEIYLTDKKIYIIKESTEVEVYKYSITD